MDTAGSIGLWLLALVFAWSGFAKARSIPAVAQTLVNFGLSKKVDRRAAWLVVFAELILAVSLALAALGGLPARPVAAVAIGLLVGLTALLIRELRAGSRFACNCFGSASQKALSGSDVVRNFVLVAVGVLVLAVGAADASDAVTHGTAALTVLLVTACLAGLRTIFSVNADPLGQADELWERRGYRG